MLLSDPRVSQLLESRFVCAWESLRPVPRITVDFGDRKLTRTLKGNTVMYVCLPDGTVVDAFPGLYTPEDFLAELQPTLAFLERLEKLPEGERAAALQAWHGDLARLPLMGGPTEVNVAKAAIEAPLLSALEAPAPLPAATTGTSPFSVYAAGISDLSEVPGRPKPTKDPVQLDSTLSRTRLRPGVHLLLAERRGATPQDCTAPLFKELLKIPIDDPYLGLGATLPGTP